MYILLFLIIVIIIYVSSFKDNFTTEHIDKVKPVLIIGAIVAFALCILASVLK